MVACNWRWCWVEDQSSDSLFSNIWAKPISAHRRHCNGFRKCHLKLSTPIFCLRLLISQGVKEMQSVKAGSKRVQVWTTSFGLHQCCCLHTGKRTFVSTGCTTGHLAGLVNSKACSTAYWKSPDNAVWETKTSVTSAFAASGIFLALHNTAGQRRFLLTQTGNLRLCVVVL